MHKTQQENTQKTAQNTNNNTIKLLTVNNWLINGKKKKSNPICCVLVKGWDKNIEITSFMWKLYSTETIKRPWILTIIQMSSCRGRSPGPAECWFWESPQTQACEWTGQLLARSGQQLVFVLGRPPGGLDTQQLQDMASRHNYCSQLQVRHGNTHTCIAMIHINESLLACWCFHILSQLSPVGAADCGAAADPKRPRHSRPGPVPQVTSSSLDLNVFNERRQNHPDV